jgi:putative endonuclease
LQREPFGMCAWSVRRRPTQVLGRRGEDLAAAYLTRRGFRVVERNCRSRLGEIDLVARAGPTLVFIEVKTRAGPTAEPPQVAVDGRKQARLARLALAYLGRRRLGAVSCRFDVVAVTCDPRGGTPEVVHFPGAFQADAWP